MRVLKGAVVLAGLFWEVASYFGGGWGKAEFTGWDSEGHPHTLPHLITNPSSDKQEILSDIFHMFLLFSLGGRVSVRTLRNRCGWPGE